MHRILIVDGELAVRSLCRRSPELKRYDVRVPGTGEDALAALRKEKGDFDLVLLDLTASGDAPETVRRITAAFPSVVVIVVGAENAVPSAAARYLKNGASDYVTQPLTAAKLAAAVEKAIGFPGRKETEKSSRETGYLIKLVEEMNRRRSKEELLAFILGYAASTLQADTGSILMFLPGENTLRLMSNIGPEEMIGSEVKMGERIAGWVAQNRKPLLLHNPSELPQFKNWAANTEIASSIVVPLIQHTRLYGVICLNRHADRANRTYTREDLDSLENFAIHSSFVLSLQHQNAARGPEEDEFS